MKWYLSCSCQVGQQHYIEGGGVVSAGCIKINSTLLLCSRRWYAMCTMLRRNLLYTGVTWGKRVVVLVGQKKAAAIAVRNVSGRRRWSKLDEWLGRRPTRSATLPMS